MSAMFTWKGFGECAPQRRPTTIPPGAAVMKFAVPGFEVSNFERSGQAT